MPESMGFCHPEWGYSPASGILSNARLKRKFRWKLIIPGVSASGVNSLPPSKSARPNLVFKEMNAEHLNETISFPAKPEWKPLNLTLYDLVKCDGATILENPIFTWIRRQYDPQNCSYWKPSLGNTANQTGLGASVKAAQVSLVLFDGCGEMVESWVYEHVWPVTSDFQDLDMASSEVLQVDCTLRYDRAYIEFPNVASDLTFDTELSAFSCTPSSVPFVPPSAIPFFGGGGWIESEEVEPPPDFKQIRW